MKASYLLGISAAILVVALIGYGIWQAQHQEAPTPSSTQNGAQSSLPRDVGAMLSFTTSRGEVISVPDFTYGHPSLDVEDTGETYVYVTQNDAGVEESAAYGIVYANNGSLIVGLFAAPISQARAEAEAKLRALMPGVADDILCRIPISVIVPDTIEPTYAGQNLGLSFCPGAVPLP